MEWAVPTVGVGETVGWSGLYLLWGWGRLWGGVGCTYCGGCTYWGRGVVKWAVPAVGDGVHCCMRLLHTAELGIA